ncbi:MAG TPA: hypothetical protein VD908_19410 [Cytophagales bacterium]|nr:hypothetical protein [Cytophagales bacterium]
MKRNDVLLIVNFIFLFFELALFLIINYDDAGNMKMAIVGATIRSFFILLYITFFAYFLNLLFSRLSVIYTLLISYTITYFLCCLTAGIIKGGPEPIWQKTLFVITDLQALKTFSLSYFIAFVLVLTGFKMFFKKQIN